MLSWGPGRLNRRTHHEPPGSPRSPGPPGRRHAFPRGRRRLPGPLDGLPPTLPPAVLPHRTAGPCHHRHPRTALDLLDRSLPGLPNGWITGDDEFGRPAEFRAALRRRHERYVLDVPCNTTVRDLERRRPPRRKAGVGRKREVPFVRADVWAKGQPEWRWARLTVRGGEKGPLRVDAMTVRVRAKEDGRIGPEERLVVI